MPQANHRRRKGRSKGTSQDPADGIASWVLTGCFRSNGMSWIKNAAKNLLPLSREQGNFTLALKEWYYAGNMHDLEEPVEICELCEHPDIRYQFEIVNQHTRNALLGGSEFIHKFEIGAIDESGTVLDTEGSRRKVD